MCAALAMSAAAVYPKTPKRKVHVDAVDDSIEHNSKRFDQMNLRDAQSPEILRTRLSSRSAGGPAIFQPIRNDVFESEFPHAKEEPVSYCEELQSDDAMSDDDSAISSLPHRSLSIREGSFGHESHLHSRIPRSHQRPSSPVPSSSQFFAQLEEAPPLHRRGTPPLPAPAPILSACGPPASFATAASGPGVTGGGVCGAGVGAGAPIILAPPRRPSIGASIPLPVSGSAHGSPAIPILHHRSLQGSSPHLSRSLDCCSHIPPSPSTGLASAAASAAAGVGLGVGIGAGVSIAAPHNPTLTSTPHHPHHPHPSTLMPSPSPSVLASPALLPGPPLMASRRVDGERMETD